MKHVFKLFLPKNRFGDYVYALTNFLTKHHRFPAAKGTLNDALFQIKTSREIDEPLRVFTTDKEYAKLFVKAVIGDRYNVGTIGVIRNRDEIASFDFPDRCCIKPTHWSGRYIIRRDDEPLPLTELKKWFAINYYNRSRERNYKTLVPKIIVEPLVFDSDSPVDYKFFCYGGKVKFIQVDIDRKTNHTRKFFDSDWKPLDFSIKCPISDKSVKRPACLQKMVKVCEELSSYFSLVRIDLYTNGTDFQVGEITHCHGSASEKFIPKGSEQLAADILFSD